MVVVESLVEATESAVDRLILNARYVFSLNPNGFLNHTTAPCSLTNRYS